MSSKPTFYYLQKADGDNPARVIVSKEKVLPEVAFTSTEFSFFDISLWFVDSDCFTQGEVKRAFMNYLFSSFAQ